MFLLNSRSPLVSATNKVLQARIVGTPYPEVTGLICRIPSHELRRHALGFSPRGTCVSSRYEHEVDLNILFTDTRDRLCELTPSPSRFRSVLTITALPEIIRLDTQASVLSLSRCVKN